jgi:methionyl-tRNA synthetase
MFAGVQMSLPLHEMMLAGKFNEYLNRETPWKAASRAATRSGSALSAAWVPDMADEHADRSR